MTKKNGKHLSWLISAIQRANLPSDIFIYNLWIGYLFMVSLGIQGKK